MCRAIVNRRAPADIAACFGVDGPPPQWAPVDGSSEQRSLPVVYASAGVRRVAVLRWGLLPRNQPGRSGTGQRVLRGEEVGAVRVAGGPPTGAPCLVPAEAFELWRHGGGRVDRFAIAEADGSALLALAGLWQPGPDGDGRFAILTLAASPKLAVVHDRMPALVPPEAWPAWLGADQPAEQRRLLAPYPDDRLTLSRLASVQNPPSRPFPPVRSVTRKRQTT